MVLPIKMLCLQIVNTASKLPCSTKPQVKSLTQTHTMESLGQLRIATVVVGAFSTSFPYLLVAGRARIRLKFSAVYRDFNFTEFLIVVLTSLFRISTYP